MLGFIENLFLCAQDSTFNRKAPIFFVGSSAGFKGSSTKGGRRARQTVSLMAQAMEDSMKEESTKKTM